MRIVIIGGSDAGTSAALRALAHRTRFEGIDLRRACPVKHIDPWRKTASVQVSNGIVESAAYHKLIVGTGAVPMRPEIAGRWKSEASKRIDVFATALFHRMTIEGLNDPDLSCTPPLSSPWDPVRMSAQAWLRENKKMERRDMQKERVLVLCTGNSARSQMAEGLLRHDFGERFEIFSAGTKPSSVRPEAIAVMRELDIDLTGHRSKHVSEFDGHPFEYVITVCDNAKESCPVFPGPVKRIHWSFEDPAAVAGSEEERLAAFRKVRDQIRATFQEFRA